MISIHALLAESDLIFAARHPTARVFLSTLSLRRATHKSLHRGRFLPFLSTLSLRRATLFSRSGPMTRPYFYPRSPCGERPPNKNDGGPGGQFLSTLSLRRATYGALKHVHQTEISIHALLAESDSSPNTDIIILDISIHALLAESDTVEKMIGKKERVFLSTLSLRRATGHPSRIPWR